MPTETNTKPTDASVGNNFLDFWTRHSLKTILTTLFVVGATVAGMIGMWTFAVGPIATINGEKISRQEYNDMSAKLAKSFKNADDKESLRNVSQITSDKLIEDKIIETESAKRGITVSDEEVNKQYNELLKQYSSEEEFKQRIAAEMDWTPELVKKNLKLAALKEKLQKEVVSGYDIEGIFIRYDGFNSAKLKTEALARITTAFNKVKNGSTFANEATVMQAEKEFNGSTSGFRAATNINESTWDEYFINKEPWEGLKKVASVNGYTEVIDVPDNEYSVYKVTKISAGTYGSWDDFVNSFKSRTLSYKIKQIAEKLTSKAYAHAYPGVSSDDTSCPPNVGTTNTNHNCCVPSSTHLGHTDVRITNKLTNMRVSGKVTATDNGNPAGHLCRNSQHGEGTWPQLPQSLSGYANSSNNYLATIGAGGTQPCTYHWKVSLDYSIPGYGMWYANYTYWEEGKPTYWKTSDGYWDGDNYIADQKIDNGTIGQVDFFVVPLKSVQVRIHGNGKTSGAVSCAGDGSVCSKTYKQTTSTGTNLALYSTPDYEWHFDHLTRAGGTSTDSSYTFNTTSIGAGATSVIDVYFSHIPTKSTLSVRVDPPNAAIATPNATSYNTTDADSNYSISLANINPNYNSTPVWTATDQNGVVTTAYTCPTGHFNRRDNKTITCTAKFTIKKYTLTLNVTGGTITASSTGLPNNSASASATFTYNSGTPVGVSAANSSGYNPTPTWSNDCATTRSLTMNANKVCTVAFPRTQHTLTLRVIGGTITATPPGGTAGSAGPTTSTSVTKDLSYNEGSPVNITASNATGYNITPIWDADCETSRSLTMSTDRVCSVVFTKIGAPTCSITGSSTAHLMHDTTKNVTLSWTSANATSVSGSWTSKTTTSGNDVVGSATEGSVTYTLNVTGTSGTGSCAKTVKYTNNAPVPTLVSPAEGASFTVGTKVALRSTITDTPDNDKVIVKMLYQKADLATTGYYEASTQQAVQDSTTRCIWSTDLYATPYTRTCYTTALTEPGLYYWYATGKDEHGKVASTDTGSFIIENPVDCNLWAEPGSVSIGQTFDLKWTTANATSATLNGATLDPDDLESGTKQDITLSAPSQSYNLVATNGLGSKTCPLVVKKPEPGHICSVEPTQGTAPLIVTLLYTSTNPNAGSKVTLDYGDGSATETFDVVAGLKKYFHNYTKGSDTPYNITFKQDGITELCPVVLNLKSPSTGDGGETN